jgi:hypothetical protein
MLKTLSAICWHMFVGNGRVLWQCMSIVCANCFGVRYVVVMRRPFICMQIKPNLGPQTVAL